MKYVSEVKVMLEIEAEDRLSVGEKINEATFSISDNDIKISRIFPAPYILVKEVSNE